MKFLHHAFAENIGRIRKNGLRMGGGQRGRGLYAVPMVLMPYVYGFNSRTKTDRMSHPVSSRLAWKWWLKRKKPDGRCCTIVFTLPERFWPVEVYVGMSPGIRKEFNSKFPQVEMDGRYLVPDAEVMGQLLHYWQKNDNHFIEVVIRHHLPPECIERIVPLYRTNKEFKKRNADARQRGGDLDD
jgi:hypothetical protein